jgi:hypothetical protein
MDDSGNPRVVRIDDSVPEIADENWSLYWSEMKSTSDYFEMLLRQPLAVVKDEIPQVDDTWHVTTQVLNHHVPLTRDPVCRLTMVMPEEKMVLNLLYKHRPGD